MVLPPVFTTFFLYEAIIIIITKIFEIMLLTFRFLKLRKNFLNDVSDTKVLFYGTVFLMNLKLLNQFIVSRGYFKLISASSRDSYVINPYVFR